MSNVVAAPSMSSTKWGIGTLAIAALGAAAVAFTPILALLVLAGLVAVFGWLTLCVKRPVAAMGIVIAMIAFSAHAFALLHQVGAPPGPLRSAIGLKDALAWTLFAMLLARVVVEELNTRVLLPVSVALAVVLLYLIMGSPAPLDVQLQGVRGALIAVLALATVGLLTDDERRQVGVITVRLVLIGASYALVELALPRAVVTDVIGVGDYWQTVKLVPQFVNPATGLPGNFYTSGGFPRLSGAFGDPLSAGSVIAVGMVLAIAYRKELRRPRLAIAILAAALLLTFTRNGWILALVTLTVLSARRYGFGRTTVRAIGVATLGVAAAHVVPPLNEYVINILNGNDASTLGHQEAWRASLDFDFSIVGRGWGTAGAAARNFFADAVSAENAYMAILVQVGIIGGLLMLVSVLDLLRVVLAEQPLGAVGAAMCLALAFSATVSENILTFNAGYLPVAAIGLVACAPAVRRSESTHTDHRRLRAV